MKKIYFLSLLTSLLFCTLGFGQTTLVLQPDAECGKDATLGNLNPDINSGQHIDFNSLAWTNRGRPSYQRGLIDFDLSSIPAGCQIIDAKLTLFGYNSPSNGSHSSLSGSNASLLQRVTAPWNEFSVTWNNQPTTTTVNQVYLPQSSYPGQDYILDVTNLVQDIVNDPDNSYGFMIRLQTEYHYRRLIFASSDNPDPSLHPKIEITYAGCNLNLLNTTVCYRDSDNDGYGDPDYSQNFCGTCPPGFVEDNTDCMDTIPSINPGVDEICDGIDNNCDGNTDEGFDQDGDGVADCFDNCPFAANPGQEDADCDGVGDVCDQWPGCDDTLDSDGDGTPDCVDLDELANWACGNKGTKVTICHVPPGNPGNRQDLCINPNAVGAHMDHNDYIGSCDQITCGGGSRISFGGSPDLPVSNRLDFEIYPNPAHDVVLLDLAQYLDQEVALYVVNQLGQQVLFVPNQVVHQSQIRLNLTDRTIPDGVYFLVVQSDEGRRAKQFILRRQ